MFLEKVSIPSPHFDWGNPRESQIIALKKYVEKCFPMSIYGDDGIYEILENNLKKIYESKYAILTNTGTSSLNSGYFGLGVERGDEVIVPTYTFLATVTPLLRLGAKIVFCDSDPITGNICPIDLEKKISSNTKVVAITHMWGIPCDMEKIIPLIQKNNLKLLEDCSHSHFTKYKGKMLGTFGDVSCMSIGAKKTMTSGEGGFLITSDPEIFIRATSLGHFEKRTKAAIKQIIENGHKDLAKKYQNSAIGYGENYRIHPYSAVMANALIESGDIYSIINNRKESLEYLSNKLNTLDRIYSPVTTDDFYTGAMYGFKAKIDVRNDIELDSIIKELKSRNIDIKRPDTGTLHQNSIFQYSYSDNDFSGAKEYLSGRVSLPTFSRGLAFDKDLIDQYTDVINYVLNGLFI